MAYVANMGVDTSGDFRLLRLETRGGGRLIFSPFFLALALARIVIETLRGRLALVHVNLADGGSVYRKAAIVIMSRAVGTPVLLHIHAGRIVPFYNSRGRFGKWLIHTMVHSANHSMVLGRLWQDWLVYTFRVPRASVSIVPNGVPATTARHARRGDNRGFHLVFVGNLLRDKGVSDLLEAMAQPALRDANVTLTLAGGGEIAYFRDMAERLGLSSRVFFTGWIDQTSVRETLVQADALVLPSYNEGLPLVVIEALASRVPAICTPVGAVPEMLEDGRTALFIRPHDPDHLAATVVRLMNDPELNDRLTEEGYALYRRQFTMQAFMDRLSQAYAMLAPPSHPRAMAMPRRRATSRPS
ncbi:MAG: glycosyltransferase family 4 protein [Acetobacteraceae bacterium]